MAESGEGAWCPVTGVGTLVLAPSGSQAVRSALPRGPVASAARLQMERVGDEAVEHRERTQHDVVKDGQERPREHVPETLGELNETFHYGAGNGLAAPREPSANAGENLAAERAFGTPAATGGVNEAGLYGCFLRGKAETGTLAEGQEALVELVPRIAPVAVDVAIHIHVEDRA